MSTYASEVILVICVASDTAPALSPESTFFVEYCTGGPSSTTPVLLELCVSSSDTAPPPYYPACLAPLCLLSCVNPFDTAPPPQDLLTGLLYTAPPPSTGDSCHGPECSRSKRVTGSYGRSTGIGDLVDTSREHGRSAVSMETMDSYRLTCEEGPGP
ncbi:uncharacterized protein UHOD_11029 [Ustilago sp. UG-2017b]|nr:uncharacterized protein UHOD_11029 [Ustilago sp. UG-2017b]